MRLADFLRADTAALRNFRMRAAAHVWPRIIRDVEEELAHPPKRRRY
jgi:hypothetical protein